MMPPLYSIVIPTYNSKNTLKALYDRIVSVFNDIDGDFELILVDDGGDDNSWEVMQSLRSRDTRVKIIRLMRNFGQHNALMCGFSHARGDYVITMDDDLQNPPEEIPKLIGTLLSNNFDMVCGAPRIKKDTLLKNMGSHLNRFLISLIFKNVRNLRLSSFRIIKKPVVDHLLRINTPNPSVGPLILKITENIGSVIVDHMARPNGKTGYSVTTLIRLSLNGILFNSVWPLKAVFILGISSLGFSALLGTYYLILYFTGSIRVPGWTTLVFLILFFSGIIMFSIGIIGEYLLRIIQEVYRIPPYIIRDKDV